MRKPGDPLRHQCDVIIDARDKDSPWHEWAKEKIADAVSGEGAGVNTVVVAEASVRALDGDAVPALLAGFGMTLIDLPVSARQCQQPKPTRSIWTGEKRRVKP